MNKFIIIYLCSLAAATGSFAQTPTASPLATTPATTAAISPTATPASKIEQSIRKKHKKHFGLTIGDHDKDLDTLDRLGEEGRTIVMIAHRMTTIARADIVVRLDNGRVAEIGSHSELIGGAPRQRVS